MGVNVTIHSVVSTEQYTDILTKPLRREAFRRHCNIPMNISCGYLSVEYERMNSVLSLLSFPILFLSGRMCLLYLDDCPVTREAGRVVLITPVTISL